MANRMWIWDRPGWPEWDYGLWPPTLERLRDIHARRERLAGALAEAPELAARAVRGALLRESSATSEIEGEHISYEDIRDVVEGYDPAADADPRAAGVVGMLELCRAAPALDRQTLFEMHGRLLGYLRGRHFQGTPPQIGAYRRTHVHIGSRDRGIIYEAPGPERVEQLMAHYLDWLGRPLELPMNATPEPIRDQAFLTPVKAAVAHIWFENIHPFYDGNGRIGRAIAERVLRGAGAGAGYLATAIDVRREGYYEELGRYGKDSQGNDISSWVDWFVHVCSLSLDWEEERMRFERDRAAFFRDVAADLSEAARRALEEILGDWPGGRFMVGVDAAEWEALLGGAAPAGERVRELHERGILSAADEPGRYNPLAHFRDVGHQLFEVGVHWIPSSCEERLSRGPASPSHPS